ncbi:hypothetical protein MPTK1_1g14690 [Marchantia polymorpha subsp. ruderalis]|uniref:Uncharacterized protein n=2 Tax=Marchantia polymorpha TaxID=3197 RepID=A0AAF6AQ76_MARPO|nr:hypothetical protein MARPO_0153s0021 [Marchantia polymorpha]BBM98596.1 hypothetical protein Mp_1g14690 [Marchantia polymorpha subsp. ruderalis]|eukprot:PTQ28854.1 hypothetical protein MARPO_0153s0021 [Marchantia polymorpha]
MASSSTAFWAAYNAVTSCCAARGSRGPYHRHCGCALHFLPHELHSPQNDCVSMPRNGMFRTLALQSTTEKRSSSGHCTGSPLVQNFESCSDACLCEEGVMSIGMIQKGLQATSATRHVNCSGE